MKNVNNFFVQVELRFWVVMCLLNNLEVIHNLWSFFFLLVWLLKQQWQRSVRFCRFAKSPRAVLTEANIQLLLKRLSFLFYIFILMVKKYIIVQRSINWTACSSNSENLNNLKIICRVEKIFKQMSSPEIPSVLVFIWSRILISLLEKKTYRIRCEIFLDFTFADM